LRREIMTYLITGATGDVGCRVVDSLLAFGERPRVFVRDETKARARFGDRVEVSAGDLTDAASLQNALQGIDALFLVSTGPRIPNLDDGAAKAAKAAGVRHLVKLSSLDVQQNLAIGGWHERGEEAIRASGVPFTFLRPSGFMSNLLAWAPSIKNEGVVRSSTGDGKRGFIHSDDIAAVATEILRTGKHVGESLPLTGPEALSFSEVAIKLGTAIGSPLRYQPISDEEARRRYGATGAPPEETEAHVCLWRAIREGRLATVTNWVERVLGRKPLGLDRWAEENANRFC
ncbi:MAG TPA: SDR family oxidoreductase, partial [Acidobacteriaceae bacterium]|nr:SDR family oxidoreductase [Acidobacteriaceae bacterium]